MLSYLKINRCNVVKPININNLTEAVIIPEVTQAPLPHIVPVTINKDRLRKASLYLLIAGIAATVIILALVIFSAYASSPFPIIPVLFVVGGIGLVTAISGLCCEIASTIVNN